MSHRSRPGVVDGLDPTVEGAVVVAGASSVGVVYCLFAATSQVATWVTRRSSLQAGWADHGRALIRLPRHLAAPRDAYAAEFRAVLPDAAVWWATGVVLTTTVGVACMLIVRLAALARGRDGWASRRDLSVLRRGRGEHRVVLGTHQGAAVAVEERLSALVIGATQSYKTSGLAVPAILEADDMAVIALSVKDDLVSDTIGWRSTLPGQHWVFDPTDVLHVNSAATTETQAREARRHLDVRRRLVRASWSPLYSSRTWQGALATAFDLTRAGGSAGSAADGDNKFFYESAESLLACYLYAAANSPGASMRTVVRWVAQHQQKDVATILGRLDSQEAAGHFVGVWKDDRKTLSNIFSTARLLIAAWLDPTVADSSESSDITPDAFFDGRPNTLYVLAPPSNQDRLRVVFNLLVKEFTDHAYTTATANGRPLDRRVLIIIDELANIAPIHNLANVASTAAAMGIQLVSILQDISQLRSRYGTDDANTIINNHRALLLLSGVKDLSTLELASKLLGNHDRPHTSTSRDLWGRRTGRTESTREAPLAPIEQIRQRERGTGVLIYGHLPGAELRMRPWFDDRRLAHKARHLPDRPGPLNPLPTTTAERRSA